MFWIVAGLIIILATVFAIQNYDNVEVTIFFLKLKRPFILCINSCVWTWSIAGSHLGRTGSVSQKQKRQRKAEN